ncbi:hypothetical protein I4U23_018417 [Adineta vaga]|nr:hypothetical protein I4U23_018417 [Adineta vaga]
MMKQSNMKLNFESSRSLRKKDSDQKSKEHLHEKNYVCQRYAARHGLLVNTQIINESKSRIHRKLIQETNINTTIIDVFEQSSSDCPLTEKSLQERIDKYIHEDNSQLPISSETKQNLTKLQKITDDVKLLTKQLQLSVQLNQNNNSNNDTLDKRLLGEICYQLERRILVLIFSKSKQLYGYSLRYLSLIIDNEENKYQRSIYKKRFQQIENYLSKENFHFNSHPILTFYFINKYGIYSDYQWLKTSSKFLSNLDEIQRFCFQFLSKEYHKDFSIIIHSLDLISHCDGKPLFYW